MSTVIASTSPPEQSLASPPSASPKKPAPNWPRGGLGSQVLGLLRQGATLDAISRSLAISVAQVTMMVDHYTRLGLVGGSASSLCTSGLGACGPLGAQSLEAKVHCAGCPLW
ncbi:MAG: hypothetical protein Q4G30_00290 [Actinomycetaceae bacterium]|nr:hypothetical protein [Actinomycetaceae bacterium]